MRVVRKEDCPIKKASLGTIVRIGRSNQDEETLIGPLKEGQGPFVWFEEWSLLSIVSLKEDSEEAGFFATDLFIARANEVGDLEFAVVSHWFTPSIELVSLQDIEGLLFRFESFPISLS